MSLSIIKSTYHLANKNLSKLANLDFKTLKNCSTESARAILPYEKAIKYGVLPLAIEENENSLSLAADNLSFSDLQEIQFLTGYNIQILKVPKEILQRSITNTYLGGNAELELLEKEFEEHKVLNTNITNALSTHTSISLSKKPSNLAARFIETLIDYAIANEASDLHLIPLHNGIRIQLRILGEIASTQLAQLNKLQYQEIINRLKILANLDISNKKLPMDGAFLRTIGGKMINIRINTLPSIHGECVALRFLGNQIPANYEFLKFSEELKDFCAEFFSLNEGALLLSGPTGSGKTNTLYAIARYLAKQNLNVITVEDPVEYQLAELSQININQDLGLTFSKALKAVLRQDPDVIMLGEIRDAESAQIALQASQTGHRLLSCVHAGNVFEVLLRLKDLDIDLLTISQTVKLIISQRLIPKLCAKCAVFDLQASNTMRIEIFKAVGCAACDYSGYSERTLICEALYIDKQIAESIAKGRINHSQMLNEITRANYYSKAQDLFKLLQKKELSFYHYQQYTN